MQLPIYALDFNGDLTEPPLTLGHEWLHPTEMLGIITYLLPNISQFQLTKAARGDLI